MHIIEPSLGREVKIYLCQKGAVRPTVYSNIDEFCSRRSLEFIKGWVGEYYGDPIKIVISRASGFSHDRETRRFYYKYPETFYIQPAEFIVRTDTGERLTLEELQPLYYAFYRRNRASTPYWRRQGLKSGCCYGRFRSPATTNERRQAFPNEDEGEPPIRGRRRAHSLPNTWDDVHSDSQKSWKYQSKRRHQYRE